ncbi:MAG TPA: hypothetical protein VGC54_09055, partial [Planctomycetota bacterium]
MPPLPDLLAGLAIAAFFGFLGLGAVRLRRIRKQGLEGHAHVRLDVAGWELVWPQWWPLPEPLGDGARAPFGRPAWRAATGDHDGRLHLVPGAVAPDATAAASLRAAAERAGAVF